MPFGGCKQSGTGREGLHDSLHFYSDAKTVCVNLASKFWDWANVSCSYLRKFLHCLVKFFIASIYSNKTQSRTRRAWRASVRWSSRASALWILADELMLDSADISKPFATGKLKNSTMAIFQRFSVCEVCEVQWASVSPQPCVSVSQVAGPDPEKVIVSIQVVNGKLWKMMEHDGNW